MGCFGCFGTTRKEVGDGSDFYSGHFDKTSAAEQVMADVVKSDARTKAAPEMVPTNMPIVQSTANVEDPAASVIQAQIFTLQELTTAANDFSPDCLIGEGGFGPVYKGRLQNGQVVAIKQLNQKGFQGNREFLVEVLMLSLLHHENLVNLIGYCAEGDQRLLVYEYMPLGSLEDRLHDLPSEREPLDWTTRMKIAAGAARGLEYLHDVAFPPVIYRDLKSSNILLGEDFYPKLSDFGLAKLGPVGDKTHVSTRVMGTYGYCAPEYAMTGQLTVKSDVYSFGVLLLELITGRRPIDPLRPHGEQKLVAWARPLFKDRRKFSQMADLNLRGHFPVRGLFQALAVAAMCLHEQAASRPAIADVVTALNFLAFQSCGPTSQVPSTTSTVPLDSAPEEVKTGATLLYTAEAGQPAVASSDENAATSLAGWADTVSEKDYRAVERAGKDRQQAVAEARLWVESLREKRGEVVAQGKGS